eukprot:c20575_g1_i1.p1 GENE.c20575_g1_i1~~c20575_g1_i1.p1  ORF type:complete len:105 (+),score=22.92 c20575_g1_i1:1094-1408(+)
MELKLSELKDMLQKKSLSMSRNKIDLAKILAKSCVQLKDTFGANEQIVKQLCSIRSSDTGSISVLYHENFSKVDQFNEIFYRIRPEQHKEMKFQDFIWIFCLFL